LTGPGPRPELRTLRIAEEPSRLDALGFAVSGRELELGRVLIHLGRREAAPQGAGGIFAWGLSGVAPVEEIDGLVTDVLEPGEAPRGTEHPNGALGIDHVVVLSPAFDRTAAELARVGIELRRIREVTGGRRQGFRRLGPVILELVESADSAGAPTRFWGLVVTVRDLDALAERLGDRLGTVRPAVQPGRMIATVRDTVGLSFAMAFMTPEWPNQPPE
jgi:hypothetical protein